MEQKTPFVQFQNVCKYYQVGDTRFAASDHISFTIEKGEFCVILGPSGAGKTTFCNLIPRFYDATKGEVLVDGVNVKEYTQKALRNKIGYVSQKAVLFTGSIKSNVAYGDNGTKGFTDDVVKQAIETAQAKEFVDTGRAQVAKAINASPAELFFTSCGSEADNWAVKGTAFTKARQNKKHLITSAFEHHAIMHSMAALERMGFEVTYIKPTAEGYIRPEDVEAAIRPDTALVSIMMANNEIGTIQPIKEITEIAHKHGVWMHTDAVQAVGAIPVDVKELGVDMLSMSAHKFNGPKGMGALYCRKGVWPQNLIDGGSQEARHRAGTENVAGIAAMGKALEIATAHLDERMAHESELRDYVIDRILKNIPEARLNGGRSPRLPNNVNISFPGLEGETILLDLDMHGICASTGSACNSDSLDPSHVLLSIGLPEEIGHGSMRFTFGPQNTMEEAKYLCDVLEEVIPRRRAMSCMWLQGQNKARQFSLKGEQ